MDALNKILDLIAKRGLSDSKFAELAGLNKAVLFDWRSGKTKSYMRHLPKIAEVLNTTVEYLLNQETTNPIVLEDNVIIYSRDGKTLKKKFTKEQMIYLEKFINSIGDDECDL